MRFWIATTVLLGLVALGLTTGPRVIDWNAYRPEVEVAAIQLSGHDVSIGGPIEITLVPRPVVTVGDVTVTGKASGAIGFALGAHQVEATLEIGPLLAGRPVVRDLRLKRPVLTVDSDSSRRLRSWPPRWQDWATPFLELDLKTIDVTDGRIELLDDRRGQPIGLSDLALQFSINGPDGPLEAAGLFKTKRHRFAMKAAFGRPDRQGMRAAKLSIEAQNGIEETTALRFNGRVTPSGADPGVRGRLTLNGPDLQHGLAAIAAATNYPSSFRSIASTQPFALEGQLDADRTGIRADDLQLRLADKLGKGRIDLALHPQTRLDLAAELPTLRLADDAGVSGSLPLDLLSKLEIPRGEIDIRLRELAYRDGAAHQASVKLETGTDGVTRVEQAKVALPGLIDVQFEGGLQATDIGPRLRGRLSAVGDDLGRSLAWLDLIEDRDQDAGWRGFSLESDVDVSSVKMAFSAVDLSLDSSRLKGEASLRFSERQRLTLDVDIERPRLDLYLADMDAKAAATGLATRFRELDADIEARFDRLTWRGVHVEQGVISADAEDGRLTLEQIALKTVGDTALALKGEVDLDNDAVDLSAELTSQHLVRALHHLKLALPVTSSSLQPLELAGEIKGTLERLELDVKADYDDGDAVIEGQAGWIEDRPWYDLTVNARHPDHQALAAQLGLAPLVPAGDAEGPLELAGRLRHEAAAPWVASGSAKLGPTTFTGSLTYPADAFAGPFEAKLSVGTPRRDSLAPFLILSGLRLTGDWTPARWLGRLPTTGLRTAWLEKAEGSLALASKGGLAGDGLTMAARLSDGLLYVERLEAHPWQGRLEAEVSLQRRRDQPVAAIAITLDQVEAADFVAWLGVKSGIAGPLDLQLEASSVGRTPYEMMAGLTGELTIRAGPGELKGLGIPALRRTVLAAHNSASTVDRSFALPFSEIATKADLSRGILTFADGRIAFDPDAGAGGEAVIAGTADLLLWIVDLTLTGADDAGAESGAPADAAHVYRLIGRPNRPEGFMSDEN